MLNLFRMLYFYFHIKHLKGVIYHVIMISVLFLESIRYTLFETENKEFFFSYLSRR